MPPKGSFHFDNEVKREVLLLVEGMEDARFFNAVLSRWLKRTDVQIAFVGSKNNFRPFLINLLPKARGFSRLRSLGIIRDADCSAADTLQSLRDALTAARLPAPPRVWETAPSDQLSVTLAILPDESSPGNLEDLCLRSIRNSPESACVDEYVQCRERVGTQIANNRLAKSKVYAYLAVGRDSGVKPGLRLGEAAEAGVWNWGDPAFQRIVDFLQNL